MAASAVLRVTSSMSISFPPTMPLPSITLCNPKIGAFAAAWRSASTRASAYAPPRASVPKVRYKIAESRGRLAHWRRISVRDRPPDQMNVRRS